MAKPSKSSTSSGSSASKSAEDTTDTTTETVEVGSDPTATDTASDSTSGNEDGNVPAAQTASDEQLAAAPNSTAARNASGDAVNDTGQGTDLDSIDTGDRHPMHPAEQAMTGAPAGADGEVTVRGEAAGGATEDEVKAAVAFQHSDLPGDGSHVLFNTSSTPVVVDREGHSLDAKARRRVPELDAVTRAAIASGDLVDESGEDG